MYSMSYFKILDSLCDELCSMIINFWWGQKQDKKNGLVELG